MAQVCDSDFASGLTAKIFSMLSRLKNAFDNLSQSQKGAVMGFMLSLLLIGAWRAFTAKPYTIIDRKEVSSGKSVSVEIHADVKGTVTHEQMLKWCGEITDSETENAYVAVYFVDIDNKYLNRMHGVCAARELLTDGNGKVLSG